MMYSFSVTRQLCVFAESFAFGLLLSFLYDIIYSVSVLFTSVTKKRHIISDIVFSILLPFLLFCFVLSYNLGTIRLYLILGIIFGVWIYHLSFAYLLRFVLEKIVFTLRRAVLFLISPVKRLCVPLKRKTLIKLKKNDKKSKKYIAKKNDNVV